MQQTKRLTLGVVLALAFFAAPALAEPGALGVWATDEEKSHIEIYECGEQLCGRIVWLKEPLNDEGTEKLDINNEDESLRERPIVGLELMTGFVESGEHKWKKGRIYDPEKRRDLQVQDGAQGPRHLEGARVHRHLDPWPDPDLDPGSGRHPFMTLRRRLV